MESFKIPLMPNAGDNDDGQGTSGEFRLLPEYEGQIEQPNLISYGTSLHVQADLVEVVHGYLRNKEDPATLIIIEFQFTSTHASRKFRHAEIIYQFQDFDPSDKNPPMVYKMAPIHEFSMDRTEKTVELTRGANLTGGGGAGPANLSLGLTWNLLEKQTKTKQATLKGVKKVHNRVPPRPPHQTAWWALSENPTDDNGVPNFLRAAILLKRKSNDKFRSTLTIKAKVDTRYKFEDRGGKCDIAPALYDPGRPRITPTRFDSDNLELVDLNNLKSIQTIIDSKPETAAPSTTESQTEQQMQQVHAEPVSPPKMVNQHVEDTRLPSQIVKSHISQPVSEHHINKVGDEPGLPSKKKTSCAEIAEPTQSSPIVHIPQIVAERQNENSESKPDVGAKDAPIYTKSTLPSEPSCNTHEPAAASGQGTETSMERTLDLLLHAVRKGVEVLAEAVRYPRFIAEAANEPIEPSSIG